MKKLLLILLIPILVYSQATYQKTKYNQVWYDSGNESATSTWTDFDSSCIKIYKHTNNNLSLRVYDNVGTLVFDVDSLGVTRVDSLIASYFAAVSEEVGSAYHADSLRGTGFTKDVDSWFDTDGVITAGLNDSSVTLIKLSAAVQDSIYKKIEGDGTAGYLPKYIESDSVGNSIIYESSSKIGIGTTDPASKLHISGGFLADTLKTPYYKLPTADGTANYVIKTDGSGVASWAENVPADNSVTQSKLSDDLFVPYSNFIGFSFDNNYENLRVLISDNGFDWDLVYDTNYNGDLRDPSVIRYGDSYYCVYTNGSFAAADSDFAVAKSYDLEHWSIHDTVSTATLQGLYNTWSPRFFVDIDQTLHVFVACRQYSSSNFHVYELHPINASLTEWSTPQLLIGDFPDKYQDIDILYYNSKYYGFYNDYTVSGASSRINWAMSDTLLYGWQEIGTLWTGYEGACVIQIDDSTFYAYFDDLISSGTEGIHYAISTDTMQTWTEPVPITSDAPTVNRNMRVLCNYLGAGTYPQKTFSGKIATNIIPGNEPSNPVAGESYYKYGTVGTVDTLLVRIANKWQKFPGVEENTAQSVFTDNDSTVLHVTFNDTIVDTKGHSFSISGTMTNYAEGHNPRAKSLYFDGSSYLTIAAGSATDLNFGQDTSFTVSAVLKYDGTSRYHVLATKRNGTDGWSVSASNVGNGSHAFYGDGTAYKDVDGVVTNNLEWQLLTYIFNTETDSVEFYLNSQFISKASINTVVGSPTNTGTFYLGRYGSGYLKGWLSELFIERRKRTKDEICQDYINAFIR